MPQVSNTNKNDFLSKKDLYERYWKCRDFELTTLWQRSIFLGTFLVLCFTGYGAYFAKAFISENTSLVLCCCNNPMGKIFEHVIADVLALIGIVFSMLWIAMAKGSKAWYEQYEHAIEAIEKEMQSYSSVYEQFTCGFGYRNRLFYHEPDNDECIFSRKGGPFSPSKINIAIGQVTLVIWIAAFCLHSIFIACLFFCRNVNVEITSEMAVFSILFCLTCLTMLVVIFVAGLPKAMGMFDIKSRWLKDCCKESGYSRYCDELTCLEMVRNGISQKIGSIQTEIVETSNVYLVIPICGLSGFKLDVFVKSYQIYANFKRKDNENFTQKDADLLRQKNVVLDIHKSEYEIGNFDKTKIAVCVMNVVVFLRKITT